MDTSFFVIFTLSFSLLGTLLLAGGSILFRCPAWTRWTQIFLSVTALLASLSAGIFLISDLSVVSGYILGISFQIDTLSAIFLFIIGICSFLAHIYSLSYLRENHHYNVPVLLFFTALFIFGMEMVVIMTSPISFLFAWEIMSISSFFLILADREKASVQAALLYITMTQMSAMAIMAGFFTSGLSVFHDFSTVISATSLLLSFSFFFFGFGLKAGLVPLHIWLPAAHPQAPSHISALLSGVMLKMAVYAFLRFLFLLQPDLPEYFGAIVLFIGLLSALFGVLFASIEKDFKKLLAFSSTENLGIIFAMIGAGILTTKTLGFGLQNPFFALAVFQSVVHAIMKSGLFLVAGVVVEMAHSRSLEVMGGIAKKFPLFAGWFLLLTLSASALPPFGAFFGEWIFIQNILSVLGDLSPLSQVLFFFTIPTIAIVGGLALYTMAKLFGISMLGVARTNFLETAKCPDSFLGVPISIFAIMSLFLGIFASQFLSFFQLPAGSTNATFALQKFIGGHSSLTLLFIFILLGVVLLVLLLVRRTFGNVTERVSDTWNCGHPYQPQMQFTATALSAPLRFFFRPLLWVKKTLVKIHLLENNPWIVRYSCFITECSLWDICFYQPVRKFFFWFSAQVARIQNGVVQFYLSLIFITLILALIIAL